MFIKVTLQGVTPLMLDRFHEGLLNHNGPKSTGRGDELSPKDQAAQKLYTDDKGVHVLPADNLLKSIIDAGVFIKVGRRQLSTRDTTLVTSFLSISENFLPIKSKGGWRVDSRGIVNQTTRGRSIAHRPIFDDWEVSFTLDVDEKEYSVKTIRELIDRAGRAIGIGVMRPAKKGRYGQSKVVSWKEIKVEESRAAA